MAEADRRLADAVANAHAVTVGALQHLDRIEAEIESAVSTAQAFAVDTPAGARELQRLLIAKAARDPHRRHRSRRAVSDENRSGTGTSGCLSAAERIAPGELSVSVAVGTVRGMEGIPQRAHPGWSTVAVSVLQELRDAIDYVTACTGDGDAWKRGLAPTDLATITAAAIDPTAVSGLLAKIRANNPTLFDPRPGAPVTPRAPQPGQPPGQQGEAATAMKKAEDDLAQQNSVTAQLDLHVIGAILNAHAESVEGSDRLLRLQQEVEDAVRLRTDLDTPSGARDFQRFLIASCARSGPSWRPRTWTTPPRRRSPPPGRRCTTPPAAPTPPAAEVSRPVGAMPSTAPTVSAPPAAGRTRLGSPATVRV